MRTTALRHSLSMLGISMIAAICSLGTMLVVAQAEVFIATETARGEWENGKFASGKPEFRFRLEVDEEQATAKLTEIIRLKNETVINQSVAYVIITTDFGNDLSSLLISENRRNQKVLTLLGKPGALATEMILLGENFFEYCKASSGRLYVSSGTVKRAVSAGDEAVQQLRETI